MRTKQLKINKNNHNNTIRDTLEDRSAKLTVPNGIIRLFLGLVVVSCFGAANVSALTYKSTVSPEFTIENAITIEVPSGGITINDLVPGNAKESDEAIVTIYSNNAYGYTLNASVGENTSSHNTTSLTNDVNNNAVFNSIAFGSSLSSLTTPGTWGYKYDSGSGYSSLSGLPKYDDKNNVAKLKETSSSTSATGDTIKMKIAAYADTAQVAGTYDNVINFAAVGKAKPKVYIQDLTLSQCQVNVGVGDNPANIGDVLTVYDRRDGNDYTVRYINGECWMTQNLRITGTISATDSNFSGSDFNVSAYDLKINSGKGGQCYDTDGFNNACSHTPDSADLSEIGNGATTESIGAWYNYYAASAGTISGSSNNVAATSDICPSNWRLPTAPSTTTNTDFNKLAGNTIDNRQSPTTGLAAFDAVPGGYYDSYFGILMNPSASEWWSASSTGTGSSRWSLNYGSPSGKFYVNNSCSRRDGIFIRCVRSS